MTDWRWWRWWCCSCYYCILFKPRPAMYSTSKLQARNASLSFLCYGTSCASQCTITIIRTNSHVSLELRAIKCFFCKVLSLGCQFWTNVLANWTSYVRLFVRSVVSLCFFAMIFLLAFSRSPFFVSLNSCWAIVELWRTKD